MERRAQVLEQDSEARAREAVADERARITRELHDIIGHTPNPPKDTDGRREDSGRGWVRELQGRWPGVLG